MVCAEGKKIFPNKKKTLERKSELKYILLVAEREKKETLTI